MLLRVIRRISEDSGIKSPWNLVVTGHQNAVAVSLKKFRVQDVSPLLVEELSLTVRHQSRIKD